MRKLIFLLCLIPHLAYALATDPGPVGALSKVAQSDGSFSSNYTSGLNYWCIEPGTTQCGGQFAGGWIAVYPYGYWGANMCGWGGSGPIVWKKWGELSGDWCSQNSQGNWVKVTFPLPPPPEPTEAEQWSMPTNKMLHTIALVAFFFFGFRQSFSG